MTGISASIHPQQPSQTPLRPRGFAYLTTAPQLPVLYHRCPRGFNTIFLSSAVHGHHVTLRRSGISLGKKNAFEAPSLLLAGGDADRRVYHPTLAVKRRIADSWPADGGVQGSSFAGLSLFGRRLGDGD